MVYHLVSGLWIRAWAVVILCSLGSLQPAKGQVANSDNYTTPTGTALSAPAPGVLANDTGAGLTAALVTGPANGTLALNADGSFIYTPTNNFSGVDGFTYHASNGSTTSSVASVVIMVLTPGELFYDNFARPTNNGAIYPWLGTNDGHFVLGSWSVTNQLMQGISPGNSYGDAFYPNASWTDYSVQAQLRFSASNAASAGILGRLNSATGAHYAFWIYPEGSTEQYSPRNGTAVMLLIKYMNWTNYTLIGNTITLPGVGTNWHTVGLTFKGSQISAYFDGIQITNVTDNGSIDGHPAYTNGGIGLNLWTLISYPYTFSVDNVVVTSTNVAVAINDSYAGTNQLTLQVPAPGVLVNDTGNGPLTAILASNPAAGSLTLTNNGGFSYTPASNFTGTDSFTYRCTDGQTTSSVATVTITMSDTPTANNDLYAVAANTTLNVGPPGILTNDTGIGSLSAILVSGPSHGNLTLTNNGGFSYTPASNFTGMDGLMYLATDGHATSSIATVAISVTPAGGFFYDNFTRPAGSPSIFPWVNESGTWGITSNFLVGTSTLNNYGYAYYNYPNWTNYSVQAQIQFSSSNAWGGSIGGRLNPATGAQYNVWVYPENSAWGPVNGVPPGTASMQITKYSTWTAYTAQNLIQLSGVGTNWHNVKLAFQGSNVFAYFDGKQITNLVDKGTFDTKPAYPNGGISIGMYTRPSAYSLSVSNVAVNPLVVNDYYSVKENTSLTTTNPGVLTNDLDVYGTNLTAVLINGPTNGILNLSSNGGFTYTPSANFAGTDGFTFQASDKSNSLGIASATISVISAVTLTVTASNLSRTYGTTNPALTVGYTGFINGDGINVLTGAPALSTSAGTTSPIGNYTISVSQGTLSATNYVFNFVNGTMGVNPAALTVTAKNTNKAYGQTVTFAGTEFTSSGLANGDTVSSVTLTSSGAPATAGVAGSPYAINATNGIGVNLTNYTVSYQPGTLTVNPTTLAVSADNKTRMYGLTNPVLTASYSGFTNNENTSVLNGSPALATTAVPSSPVGGYPITIGQGTMSNVNYGFIFNNGTLTVTSAPAPMIFSFGLTNGTAIIKWTSLAGETYRVQTNNGLGGSNWNDASPAMMANGSTAAQTNSLGGTAQQFYRILLSP